MKYTRSPKENAPPASYRRVPWSNSSFSTSATCCSTRTPSTSGCSTTLLLTLRAHGKDVLWDDFNATRKRLAAAGPNPEAAIKGALAFYCANDSETEVLWHEARESVPADAQAPPVRAAAGRHHARAARLEARLPAGHHRQPAPAGRTGHRGLRHRAACSTSSSSARSSTCSSPTRPSSSRVWTRRASPAAEAVFVGDRPDNDIGPAKAGGHEDGPLQARNPVYSL